LLAVSGAEQKKFRIAIHMVEDGVVFRIVYGNDIMDVRGKFVKYMRKE
jgi:hypothetical protein